MIINYTQKMPAGLFFILFSLLFQSVTAQQRPAYLINYTVKNGLSANEVKCIFKDSKGFMWIGTSEGINKFNGYNFKVYNTILDDPASVSDNDKRAITED